MSRKYVTPHLRLVDLSSEGVVCASRLNAGHEPWGEDGLPVGGHEPWGEDNPFGGHEPWSVE